MFNAHVIDCEFPLDVGATVEEDGKVVESSMKLDSPVFVLL